MKNFDEFLNSLLRPISTDNQTQNIVVQPHHITDHNIDDIYVFKKIYNDAYNKQQYIARDDKLFELKVGIKIINNQGINRYFVSIKQITRYLYNQKLTVKKKMELRLDDIVQDILDDPNDRYGFKSIYHFPHNKELRVIVVWADDALPFPSCYDVDTMTVAPFYFDSEDSTFTEAHADMHESEWGKLKLPFSWGEYENAINIYTNIIERN